MSPIISQILSNSFFLHLSHSTNSSLVSTLTVFLSNEGSQFDDGALNLRSELLLVLSVEGGPVGAFFYFVCYLTFVRVPQRALASVHPLLLSFPLTEEVASEPEFRLQRSDRFPAIGRKATGSRRPCTRGSAQVHRRRGRRRLLGLVDSISRLLQQPFSSSKRRLTKFPSENELGSVDDRTVHPTESLQSSKEVLDSLSPVAPESKERLRGAPRADVSFDLVVTEGEVRSVRACLK